MGSRAWSKRGHLRTRKRSFEANIVERSRRVASDHASEGMIHLSPTGMRLNRSIPLLAVQSRHASRVVPSTGTLLHMAAAVPHDAARIIDNAWVCVPRQPALPNKQDRNGGVRQRRTGSPSGGDCGSFDIHLQVNATKRPQSRGERLRALRERFNPTYRSFPA